MGTNVRRYLTGLVALAVALAVLMGLSPAAFAASLDNPPPGTNLWYRVDGRNLLIGAIKKLPDGRLAYCMRAGAEAGNDYSGERKIDDNGNVRRIALAGKSLPEQS